MLRKSLTYIAWNRLLELNLRTIKMVNNGLKQYKSSLKKFCDGSKNTRIHSDAFPRKKLIRMKRKLSNLIKENDSLKKANLELIFKLNDTNINMANVTLNRHELITTNFNLMLDYKKKKEENVKLFQALRLLNTDLKVALTNVGNLSESLINMSNKIKSNLFNLLNTEGSPNSSTIEKVAVNPPESQNIQKTLNVSPMVNGYVIHKPTVSLQRLKEPFHSSNRIMDSDIMAINHLSSPVEFDEETRQEFREQNENMFNLTTIQEESPNEFQTNTIKPRGRLGLRLGLRRDQASSESGTVISRPEVHPSQVEMKELVVSLHDVSEMLNNSSWCFVPQVDLNEESNPERKDCENGQNNLLQEANASLQRKSRGHVDCYGEPNEMSIKLNDISPNETVQPSSSCRSSAPNTYQSEPANPGPSCTGNVQLRNVNLRRCYRMSFLNNFTIENNSFDPQSSMETELCSSNFERKESDNVAVDEPFNITSQMASTPIGIETQLLSIQNTSQSNGFVLESSSNLTKGKNKDDKAGKASVVRRKPSVNSNRQSNGFVLESSSNLTNDNINDDKARKASVVRRKPSVNSNRQIKKKGSENKKPIPSIRDCSERRSSRATKAIDYKETGLHRKLRRS